MLVEGIYIYLFVVMVYNITDKCIAIMAFAGVRNMLKNKIALKECTRQNILIVIGLNRYE